MLTDLYKIDFKDKKYSQVFDKSQFNYLLKANEVNSIKESINKILQIIKSFQTQILSFQKIYKELEQKSNTFISMNYLYETKKDYVKQNQKIRSFIETQERNFKKNIEFYKNKILTLKIKINSLNTEYNNILNNIIYLKNTVNQHKNYFNKINDLITERISQ